MLKFIFAQVHSPLKPTYQAKNTVDLALLQVLYNRFCCYASCYKVSEKCIYGCGETFLVLPKHLYYQNTNSEKLKHFSLEKTGVLCEHCKRKVESKGH